MIDIEKIEKLVKVLEASSLTEMTVKDGEFKITMSKLDNAPVVASVQAVPGIPAAPAPAVPNTQDTPAKTAEENASSEEEQ